MYIPSCLVVSVIGKESGPRPTLVLADKTTEYIVNGERYSIVAEILFGLLAVMSNCRVLQSCPVYRGEHW